MLLGGALAVRDGVAQGLNRLYWMKLSRHDRIGICPPTGCRPKLLCPSFVQADEQPLSTLNVLPLHEFDNSDEEMVR